MSWLAKLAILALMILVMNPHYLLAEDQKAMSDAEAVDAAPVIDGDAVQDAPTYCPVCGPEEEEMEALTFSYKHKGQKYSFCSMGCLKAFRQNPEKYIEEVDPEEADHTDADPHDADHKHTH